ncbi:MAG: hypothetical protein R3F22_00725 [Lysobacteraceae bacterium]
MTRFIELVIAFLMVAALFVIVGVFLPSSRHVEHTVETNHPIRQVYDFLNGFQRFKDWNQMRAHDPRVQYTIEGPRRGEGAQLHYNSWDKRVGKGTWTITRSDEDAAIRIDVQNDDYGTDKTYQIDLEEKIGSTSVAVVNITMGYDVDYGWNLFGRYAGLYLSRNIGDDIEAGLNNIVDVLATMPNFDYSYLDLEEVAVQPMNVLHLETKSKRVIVEVYGALLESSRALIAAAERNNLDINGPVRLVTINFGDSEYKFAVELPVAAKSADSDDEASDDMADDAASMDDEAMADADAVDSGDTAIQPVPALPELDLPDTITAQVSYAGRAILANVQGDSPARLNIVRESLRSYAMANGLTANGYPFEDYLQEINETIPEFGDYKVYWPIIDPDAAGAQQAQ